MINIGIDTNKGLVYEGDGHYGRGLWPTPVITSAKFLFPSDEVQSAESASNYFGYRFREDSFDPISRIRRGRFYCAEDRQPRDWHVQPHPALPLEPALAIDNLGSPKQLHTFYGNSIWNKFIHDKRALPTVLLGVDNRFTSWTIISVEAISTGEDLVTLKAQSSFGILPHIKEDKIPEAFQAKLNETLDRFADEVHRSSPISVIDRARDAVAHALLAHFHLKGEQAQDLSKLIKKLEEQNLVIAANAANIIGRLHARAKPSEQEKRELHAIREQDAELATQCVGTLLCEIGFAEWA